MVAQGVREKRRAAADRVDRAGVGVAAIPLGLIFLSFMLVWAWRALEWPLLVYLPPPHWALVALTVAGAAVGVSRRVPVWSYSWIAAALYGLGTIGEVVVFSLQSRSGVVEPAVEATFARTSGAVSLVWVLLALTAAIYLSRRSRRDGLYIFALFVGVKSIGFPILTGVEGPTSAPAVTSLLAALALVEGAALVWLLRGRLRGDGLSWLPVWGTVGIAAANVPLKLWPLLLDPGPLMNRLRIVGVLGAEEWLQEGLLLIAAFVTTWVYLALREKGA